MSRPLPAFAPPPPLKKTPKKKIQFSKNKTFISPQKKKSFKPAKSSLLASVPSSAHILETGSELVVFRALRIIREHLISLIHFFKLALIPLFLVRVIFMRHLVKSLLNFFF